MTMSSSRRPIAALILGALLASLAAWVGPLLDPPALARWTVQTHEENDFRAAYAFMAIRHLPMFLLAVAAGRLIFQVLEKPSVRLVAASALPWLLYVVVTGVMESVAIGEKPFEWVVYQPAYFIWPHFVAIPAGLCAASRMVNRRR
ncbi:MAG: hypothetical protein V4639_04100 [Pseudomonadota bacterium]